MKPKQTYEHHIHIETYKFCQTSIIGRTKFQNYNVSCLALQLTLPKLLKRCVEWRMKM